MPKTQDFFKLKKAVAKEYGGKSVAPKYRSKYGKRYGQKDVIKLSYAIAKSKGIRIHKSY